MHNARVYIPLSSLFLAPILSLASFLPFLFLISLAPTFVGLISRPFPLFFWLQYVPLLLPFPFLFLISVCKKVLNWGLGPHEDQTAEMVLILHKGPHFPQLWDILGLEIVFLYHKWRNIEISTSILLYSTCSDLGSSKALKQSSFSLNFSLNYVFYHFNAFCPQVLKEDLVFARTA